VRVSDAVHLLKSSVQNRPEISTVHQRFRIIIQLVINLLYPLPLPRDGNLYSDSHMHRRVATRIGQFGRPACLYLQSHRIVKGTTRSLAEEVPDKTLFVGQVEIHASVDFIILNSLISTEIKSIQCSTTI
jgi:hypothetical protein